MATIRVDAIQSYWKNESTPSTVFTRTDFLRVYNTPNGGEASFCVSFPIDGIASFSYAVMHLVVIDTDESHRDVGFPIYVNQITSNWSCTDHAIVGGWENYGTTWFNDYIAVYRDQWFASSKLETNEQNYNRYRVDDFINAAKSRGDTLMSVQIGWNATGGVWSLHHVDVGAANTTYTPYIIFYGATASAGSSHQYPTFTNPAYQTNFPYPNKLAPVIPAGQLGIVASNDTYLDRARYPMGSAGNSSLLKVQGGNTGKKTIYLDFSLEGIAEIQSATLKMYCVDSKMDGSYLPLVLEMRKNGWNEDQTPSDIWAITKSYFNRVYACAEIVDGIVSIDVTNFVQTALGMGLSSVSFSIDTLQQPESRELYMTFASKNSSAGYKPLLVINYIIPVPRTVNETADEDCSTDPDRPVQSHNPLDPVINHEWDEYPVSAIENQLYWVHFPLDGVNGVIKEAKLHFTIRSDSSWNPNYDTYSLAIFGHNLAFDQETWNYGSHTSTRALGLACTLNRVDYDGLTKEVEFDVTKILQYSQYNGGILFSIGGEANKICTIIIAGLWSTDYPYLTLKVEDYDHPSAMVDTDAGKAIVYPTSNHLLNSTESGNMELSGDVGCEYYFNLNTMGIPAEDFNKIDMAVLHVPLIQIYDKLGGSLNNPYYANILMECYLRNSEGNFFEVGGFDIENIYNVTVTQRPAYIEILIPYFNRKDAREFIAETNGIFSLWFYFGGAVNKYGGQEFVENDACRFGSVEGDYPAYLEIRWDDAGIEYYVSTVSGNDANDGISPMTPWATIDHAMKTVPEGKTLNLISWGAQYGGGSYSYEPADNRIAPINRHVYVVPATNDEQYNTSTTAYEVPIKFNAGTPYSPFFIVSDYGFPVDGVYTMTAHFDNWGFYETVTHINLQFDVGEITYPVYKAVLKIPVASRSVTNTLYVCLIDGNGVADHFVSYSIAGSTPFDIYIDITATFNANVDHNPTELSNLHLRIDPSVTPASNQTISVGIRQPTLYIVKTEADLHRGEW